MPTLAEVQAKIDKLPTNLDRQDAIVNGPAEGGGSVVTTDNGNVKTLARVIKEIEVAGEGAIGDAVQVVIDGRDEALTDIEAAKAAGLDAITAKVGTVETAKGTALTDITSKVGAVESAKTTGLSDIATKVGAIETARAAGAADIAADVAAIETAKTTGQGDINTKVAAVETSKGTALTDIATKVAAVETSKGTALTDIATKVGAVETSKAAALASIATKITAVEESTAMPVFTTMAGALAAITAGTLIDGQLFAVKQEFGQYAEVYARSGSTAVYQDYSFPYATGIVTRNLSMLLRDPNLVGLLPTGCIVDLDMIDLCFTDGVYVGNRAQGASAPNLSLLVFDDGQIRRDAGSGTMTLFADGNAVLLDFTSSGTLGLNNGTRITASGTPWWMRFKIKAFPGGGTINPRYGPTDASQSVAVPDDGVYHTVSYQFAGTGNGLPTIRGAVSTALKAYVKEIEFFEGSLPAAYSSQHGGHMKAPYPGRGRLERSGYHLSGANGKNKAVITFPNFPARTSFPNGITVIAATRTNTTGGNDRPIIAPIYDNIGSPTISQSTFGLLLDIQQGTVGELSARPDQNSHLDSGYVTPPGLGVQMLGITIGLTRQSTWLNEFEATRAYSTITPFDLLGLWVAMFGGVMEAEPGTFTYDGDYYNIMVFNRELNHAEMYQAMGNMRARLALKGTPQKTIPYLFITPGDSNTEWSSLPSWFWQMATVVNPLNADGTRRWQAANCAAGGHGFSVGANPDNYFEAILTREVLPCIEGAYAQGSKPIVLFMDATNNFAALSAAWDTAYRDVYWKPWAQTVRNALDAGAAKYGVARGKFYSIDTLPKGSTSSGGPAFEVGTGNTGGRVAWNNWKRSLANVGVYADGHIDFIGTPWDSPGAAVTAGYLATTGDIHTTPTGATALATIVNNRLAADLP